MDRRIVYQGAIPQDSDLLITNQNAMVGLGSLAQAILGTGTQVDGLACTPTTPASLSVVVAPGSIYSQESLESSAYGSLPADTTHQIVKQGLILNATTLACPAPATSGQSRVYLVEAAYQDVDDGSVVLPYYNASDPSQAFSGPSDSGVSQNTERTGVCKIQIKAGVAATTGTQVTPSPTAGFIGLYAVTVANGQSTITGGSIARITGAPFLDSKLADKLAAVNNLSDLANPATARTNLGAAARGANADITSMTACDTVQTPSSGVPFTIETDQYVNCTNRAGTAPIAVRGLEGSLVNDFLVLGQFLSNNAAPGYVRIPIWTGSARSYLYVQWGFNTIPPSSTYALTFPTAFPNTCFAVLATQQTSSTPSSYVSTGLPSTTGVTFYPSNGTLANGFYWLAIGN